jgi:large subunit ribosomal protein L29
MDYKDIKELSATELKKKKSSLVQDLFDAKIKNQLGQLGNPFEIRHLRKSIARLNTALVQKVVR